MTRSAAMLSLLLAAACAPPPAGVEPPAPREPDPPPVLPMDFKALDVKAAVESALQIGAIATAAAVWEGHVGSLALATRDCPTVWTGPLPEDADVDGDFEEGLTWLDNCGTPAGVQLNGWNHWETGGLEGTSRSVSADARVVDAGGVVLYDFVGEASDSLDADGSYASSFLGELTGTLAGIGSGLRGEVEASWSPDGTLRFFGNMTTFDGFGPPDNRIPDMAPELENLPGWTQGDPRFTSVRFDLEFTADCAAEPLGYVGIRGNEGFWFDVYFLPIYDPTEGSAQSNAFPFEEIDNVACDGIGTMFSRNVSLKEEDEADPAWSREVSPDFAGVVASLPTPSPDDYVFTLRDLPEE